MKSLLKCTCTTVLPIVFYKGELHQVLIVSCVFVADAPKTQIGFFKFSHVNVHVGVVPVVPDLDGPGEVRRLGREVDTLIVRSIFIF